MSGQTVGYTPGGDRRVVHARVRITPVTNAEMSGVVQGNLPDRKSIDPDALPEGDYTLFSIETTSQGGVRKRYHDVSQPSAVTTARQVLQRDSQARVVVITNNPEILGEQA